MKKLFFSIITLASILTACSSNSSSDDFTVSADSASCEVEEEIAPSVYPVADDAEENEEASVYPAKLIKSGRISVDTNDLMVSKNKIDSLLKRMGGYAESEEYYEGRAIYSYALRIPAENFTKFVDALDHVGAKVSHKSITIEDNTKQYAEIESSKKNKDAQIEQYRVLLKQAKNVTEVMAVKTKIDELQSEANMCGQRMKTINSNVKYSYLELELYGNVEKASYWSELGDAAGNGVSILKTFFKLLVTCWPLILIGLGIFLGMRYIGRHKKQ